MSAPSQTRIFGIKLGIDPKYLLGGLLGLALLLFFYNSHSSDSDAGTGATATTVTTTTAAPSASTRKRIQRRNRTALESRGTLRIRPVDATRGDIDPTLRLDMLNKLQSVADAPAGRSLFEVGAVSAPSLAAIEKLNKHIEPAPVPMQAPPVVTPVAVTPRANIPLKYYGFVKPAAPGQRNRGLFLQGDNIITASEGDLIDHRYLVVEITTANARMEDTQIKQGQTLPVTPEALQE